jgi:hypothetical protein
MVVEVKIIVLVLAMKAYGVVEVLHHSCFTLELMEVGGHLHAIIA